MTANAGYHAYATGDVLTAAQVQYNLQNQTVMYFATTTARDAALTGAILVEGMVSYTPATGVMYYNGTAWTAVGSVSPLTTKGDLYSYSTTNARLPVGSDGQTLVANSSQTTGLAYTNNFAAGKNAIINGDFRINQRNFTSNTANLSFNFDRFQQQNGGGGTFTSTPQVFTPGAAPIAGYEATNFLQVVTAGQSASGDYGSITQRIEDGRTFAGQTVTISFFARATSGTPKMSVELSQFFGSGGSPSASTSIVAGAVTISTSWARYSLTVAVPSVSGKTFGTVNDSSFFVNIWLTAGSALATRASSIGIQNNTFQIWGVQAEASGVATAFQTASGTIGGELALCQRYYEPILSGSGGAYTASNAFVNCTFQVPKRTTPTLVTLSATCNGILSTAAYISSSSASYVLYAQSSTYGFIVTLNGLSGMTANYPFMLGNMTAAPFAASAEL